MYAPILYLYSSYTRLVVSKNKRNASNVGRKILVETQLIHHDLDDIFVMPPGERKLLYIDRLVRNSVAQG